MARDGAKTQNGRREMSQQEQQARKERVLTQGRASVVRGISDAVVLKDGDSFFLAQADGQVPLGGTHGYGLYYHDCRYLHGYELELADTAPNPLVATANRGGVSPVWLRRRLHAHLQRHFGGSDFFRTPPVARTLFRLRARAVRCSGSLPGRLPPAGVGGRRGPVLPRNSIGSATRSVRENVTHRAAPAARLYRARHGARVTSWRCNS